MSERDESLALRKTDPHELAPVGNPEQIRVLAVAMAEQLGPAIAQGVAQGIAQSVGASIIPTPQRVMELQVENEQLRDSLRRMAQHAVNVLTAFQICASGRQVYVGADTFGYDSETATSIAALMKAGIDLGCDGTSLYAKPSAKHEGPLGLESKGGIFGDG